MKTPPLSLLLALPVLFCAGVPAEEAADPELLEIAKKRAVAMGETVMSTDYESTVGIYRRIDATHTFQLSSTQRKGEIRMKRLGREISLPVEETPPELEKGESGRISLYQHEGKLFLKEEMTSTMQGSVDEPLRFEGTYEAHILEGNWEGYLAGEKLVFTLCDSCQKRYASEIDTFLSSPERLNAVQKKIRRDLRAMNDSILEKHGRGDSEQAKMIREQSPGVLYLIENGSIQIGMSQSGLESTVFTVEGDQLTAKNSEVTSEVRFVFLVP